MITPIHPAVRLGHVHLKVADLDRAIDFYSGVLGLRVSQRWGRDCAFLAAGDYHHHIALNAWDSAGGAAPDRCMTGLYHLALLYPDRATLADALRRLDGAGIEPEQAFDHGTCESLYTRDYDGNGVELYRDRAPEKWPRMPDGNLCIYRAPLDLDDLRAEAVAG